MLPIFDAHCHLPSPHFNNNNPWPTINIDIPSVACTFVHFSQTLDDNISGSIDPQFAAIQIKQLQQWAQYKNEYIDVAVGTHPYDAVRLQQNWGTQKALQIIENIANAIPSAVAIGEIGLDMRYGNIDFQREAFALQLNIAVQRKLPAVLHCVKATHILQNCLKNIPHLPPILWHGCRGSLPLAKWLWQHNVYLSLTAGVEQTTSQSKLAKVMANSPKDRILIESDRPFAVEHAINQKRQSLYDLLTWIAQCKNWHPDDCAHQCYNNTTAFFQQPAMHENIRPLLKR